VLDRVSGCTGCSGLRQTESKIPIPSSLTITMTERQCPECGGELGLAVRPGGRQGTDGGPAPATTLSTLWRCSTCGHAFTSEQVREGKRQRSKALKPE